jgi:hypothetical protein
VLAAIFLWPTLAFGWRFGVGPDEPVYLWWARLGASHSISSVGARPGMPALIPAVTGTLHLPLVPALAGLEYALGVAVGLATVALVRGRSFGGRPGWLLAGLFAGMFGVHLAAGYVANIAFAVTFVAAAAALAQRDRRGTMAAALLLGGGGLSHPQFFLVGAVILAAAGALAWMLEPEQGWRSDAGRVLAALGGSGAVVLAGLASMLVGPTRLSVDTSRDGFLRRAGLDGPLRDTYLVRFRLNVGRYAPWVTLPLATIGLLQVRGFTRRFLVSWMVFTVVVVPLSIVTRWFPPDRIMTFGFALPILAACGITWIWERTAPRRWLTVGTTVVLVALMAWPTAMAQTVQSPFMSPEDIQAGTEAGRIAATLPPGTPLVFAVDDLDTSASFLATHVANIARATVSADRIQDVYVFVGTIPDYFAGRPTVKGSAEYDELSRRSLAELPPEPRALFVVPEYDRDPAAFEDTRLERWTDHVWTDVPGPRDLAPLPGELTDSNPLAIAASLMAVLALLWVVGMGWASWATGDRVAAAAAAPAFGVAALTIAALVLERLGVPLTGSWGPTLASALAGLGGYGLGFLQRQVPPHPPAQVDERPDDQHQHHGRHDPVPEP